MLRTHTNEQKNNFKMDREVREGSACNRKDWCFTDGFECMNHFFCKAGEAAE